MNGGQGQNVCGDLCVEFYNKTAKEIIKRTSILTDKVFDRTGKYLKMCKSIIANLDKEIGFYSSLGRHNDNEYIDDVATMVAEMANENFFTQIPGRFFPSFKHFSARTLPDGPKLKMWIKKQKYELDKEMKRKKANFNEM